MTRALKSISCTAILLTFGLSIAASAQDMPSPNLSGPVDIQAQEQEFAEDHMVAKGSVRVHYKDSIINAPLAMLYKDATGNLQRAVFSGHSTLVQGTNKLEAETITFEMASQKVLAEGNAHSEVISNGPPPTKVDKVGSAKEDKSKTADKPQAQTTDTIVTDSDRQEYDRGSGKFIAIGHVRVKNGDISAKADKLQLMYGADNKPETAIFTGNATATQNRNSTSADNITYFLNTKRLQATGHVKSQVIQQKKAEASKKGGPNKVKAQAQGVDPGLIAVAGAQQDSHLEEEVKEDPITITSDAQDLSQDTGRITANGNVRVYYQDTTGVGPKIVVVRNLEGKPEKVYFVGRSQVSQPGRRWIADRITMTVATRKVLAEGNTKAYIIQTPQKPAAPASESQLANRPGNQSISASKVERAQ